MSIDTYLANVRKLYTPSMNKFPSDREKNIFAGCVQEYALHVLLRETGHQNALTLAPAEFTAKAMFIEAEAQESTAMQAMLAASEAFRKFEAGVKELAAAEVQRGR